MEYHLFEGHRSLEPMIMLETEDLLEVIEAEGGLNERNVSSSSLQRRREMINKA